MDKAENLWFLDTLVTPLILQEQGSDRISVLESRAPHGDSPPLHVHAEDEIFVVLEGAMQFRVGDRNHRLGSGEALLGPKCVPHTYRVESDQARWLVITGRGDFERFVRSFSRPAPRPELPPRSGPPTRQQIEALTDACRRHDIQLVGPPLHDD
jgi:quercetin dioxygenase-like cupin family protein